MKVSIATFVAVVIVAHNSAAAQDEDGGWANIVSVGQRPYYLIDQMKPSSVKDTLGMSSPNILFVCFLLFDNNSCISLLAVAMMR